MAVVWHVPFQAWTNCAWHEPFVLSAGGAPRSLAGAELFMSLRRKGGEVVRTLVVNDGFSIIDEPAGIFAVDVPADVMAALGPGEYEHDMLFRQDGRIERIWYGSLTIRLGVTHAP